MKKLLLVLNCMALAIGSIAGPLLLRFYFLHGGSRRWVSALLQTAGWPLPTIPLYLSYITNPKRKNHITVKLFIASCALGTLMGLANYMYAWGLSYLPVSTSSLLVATQLGFTAVFSYLLVGQKFTPYSLNAIILLTMGSVLLAFNTKADRPRGVTKGEYALGFLLAIGGAALFGLVLPLIELVYKKTKNRRITYTLVMEMQVAMSFTATVVSTIGMIVNKDYQATRREAKASDVGEVGFYTALVCSAICWELGFLGLFGVISLMNSLSSGIIIAVCIPLTEVLGTIAYHEKFSGEKGMTLAMALWGFASYLYGEHRNSQKQKRCSIQNESIGGGCCESATPTEMGGLELIVEEPKSNQTAS